MINKNKKQLIISSIIILIPIIVGLMMWDRLPDTIATHWGLNGQVDGWSSKTFVIFGQPIIMLALHWLCVVITDKDPKNKDQNDKVFKMVLWILPIISLLISSMEYAVALGMHFSIDIIVRVLFGLMFLIIGNYMPKCKQNHTIGVKVIWTLRNEENWNRTHRFTGRVWVIGGVFLLATLFISMESFWYIFVPIIMLLCFAPIIYSYVYYKKQLKSATTTKRV